MNKENITRTDLNNINTVSRVFYMVEELEQKLGHKIFGIRAFLKNRPAWVTDYIQSIKYHHIDNYRELDSIDLTNCLNFEDLDNTSCHNTVYMRYYDKEGLGGTIRKSVVPSDYLVEKPFVLMYIRNNVLHIYEKRFEKLVLSDRQEYILKTFFSAK